MFSESVDKSLTLTQQGIDSLMSAEIKQTLYRNYHIDLDIKHILELTFDQLMNLSNETGSKDTAKRNNKHRTSTCLVQSEAVLEVRSESNSINVFFCHSIEGNVDYALPLAKTLNANIYGLQCTSESKFNSIQEYARYYEKLIRSKQKEGPYIISGYAYGALIAMEIAFILEKSKENVKIIFIEGSLEYQRIHFDNFSVKPTGDNVDVALLINFALTFPNVKKEQVSVLFILVHKFIF